MREIISFRRTFSTLSRHQAFATECDIAAKDAFFQVWIIVLISRTLITGIFCLTLQASSRALLTGFRLQYLMNNIVPVHANVTVCYIVTFVTISYAHLAC